jgi:hypothetical protein
MRLLYVTGVLTVLAVPAVGRADATSVPGAKHEAPAYQDSVRIPAAGGVWHQISHATMPTQIVDEYTPAHESGAAWTQIITVKTLPLARDPAPIVQGAVALMRDVCGKVNVVHVAHSQELGEVSSLDLPLPIFDAADTLVTCRQPDMAALHNRLGTNRVTLRKFEVTWYKAIRGQQANYIVQRAWHGDEIDATSVLGSDAVLGQWKTWISRVTLVRARATNTNGPKF